MAVEAGKVDSPLALPVLVSHRIWSNESRSPTGFATSALLPLPAYHAPGLSTIHPTLSVNASCSLELLPTLFLTNKRPPAAKCCLLILVARRVLTVRRR